MEEYRGYRIVWQHDWKVFAPVIVCPGKFSAMLYGADTVQEAMRIVDSLID